MMESDQATQYEALTDATGFVRVEDWTWMELIGDDRKSFLHNFCTADVKGLVEGSVTEAFVLDGKGKTIGHVHVAALDDRLLLTGAGNQGKILFEHLDRYIIREKVTIVDRSAETVCLMVVGPDAGEALYRKFQIELAMGEAKSCCDGALSFDVLQTEIAGPGFLFGLAAELYDSMVRKLEEADVVPCSLEVLNAVRIEYGTPWFGVEIGDTNLPQEFERDEKAISFVKGCYLGQETVARIDALGRVNKLLRVAEGGGDLGELSVGSNVWNEGVEVGTLLSAAKIPGKDRAVASLMLKRSSATVGQKLVVGHCEVVVIQPR